MKRLLDVTVGDGHFGGQCQRVDGDKKSFLVSTVKQVFYFSGGQKPQERRVLCHVAVQSWFTSALPTEPATAEPPDTAQLQGV